MCGIVGAFNAPKAAEQVAAALHHIQGRARDYAGIVTTDGANMYRETGPGAVRDVFTKERLDRLHGRHAVGHIRYPTVSDDPERDNIQPIRIDGVALAHNGNLTNAEALRRELSAQSPLATSMDSECILRLFHAAEGSMVDRLSAALAKVRGSYSLLLLFPNQLVAARDPSGNRPLVIGRKAESFFVASETVALDGVGAEFVRDVEPGEIVVISQNGLESHEIRGCPVTPKAPCVFEEIYFAHPASRGFDRTIVDFRIKLGHALAEVFKQRFNPLPAIDLVTPVPDSANFIGLGVAQILGPHLFLPAITRSHDVGRTFVAADQILRDWLVRQKYSVIPSLVARKSVVVVDDSIVRLTTLPPLVGMIRTAGARAVHVLVACPPICHPCRYGINTPTYRELAAATMSLAEIKQRSCADTLTFLPLERLRALAGEERCFACMTGVYPLPQ
ncbi:MAG: amidophosphoribosyltransferase [bacterium]|nr:amidophosphoribosyltransferase [bacterium]MDZ4285135.1 amidophosphoribosyltransferase [Patescibacteria group bacterium]